MSDKKKNGLNIKKAIDESGLKLYGGYSANQNRISGDGRVEYVYKNGKFKAVPYIEASGYKGKKGKARTSVDRTGVNAEYKPTKDSYIRAGASTDPKGTNKQFGLEVGGTFKEGGMIIKDRQYLKGK
tara:strand:- start:436 stop:816 length:381 start_codon:yes stop_codon:yes gene_type:complete